ncbi:zinc ABC transporter substrate-binding protein [Roseobacter sp. HKCC-CH-9208]|uniref:zinc ABC transporter substrate-binding protein n=1 Tax=Roseobacter sp. HKCC-CH-9208 TaxID=3120339 RepID=UPI0030EB71D6
MSMRFLLGTGVICAFSAATPSAAVAEVPRVVTDIAPVHSLVAQVMAGVGVPDLLIDQATSPHHFALRPSQARALQEADLVIWIGAGLSPALSGAIADLAGAGKEMALLSVPQTDLLPIREDVRFEAHRYDDHDDHGHDDQGHDDHEDEGHEDHAHDDAIDPHAWLDPDNAALWLTAIAEELAAADPDHAQTYLRNAENAARQVEDLADQIEADFAATPPPAFIVFHDAYQYFEDAFDISAQGAISLSDASSPSVARLSEIRRIVAEQGVECLFAEPQFDPDILSAVADAAPVSIAVIDPYGGHILAGVDLYPALLQDLATGISGCKG